MKASLRGLNLVESAGIGATATFMPLFANSLTSSYILVGAIVAGYGLAQALSYTYFGKVYDRRMLASSKMSIIRLGYLICAVVFFLHMVVFDGLSLFAIRIAAGVATGMYAGALIAKSYESTQAGKFTLAGIISFGSLGWFAGTIGTGFLKEMFAGDINIVFTFSGTMFLAGFFITLLMGRNAKKEPEICAIVEKPANVTTTMQLLRQNKIVYSSFFLRQLGASAVWSLFPIFLAHELGASDIWIGAIYATNAITQFIFMNWYGRTINANYYRSIELGAILSAVVFLAYFLSQSYFHIFPIQVVLGLSWSLLYIGSLLYLLDRNKEKATSSALLESTISIAAIIGPIIGGVIAELTGLRNVLLFAFLSTLCSFAMSKRLAKQTAVAPHKVHE